MRLCFTEARIAAYFQQNKDKPSEQIEVDGSTVEPEEQRTYLEYEVKISRQ